MENFTTKEKICGVIGFLAFCAIIWGMQAMAYGIQG